MRELLAAARSDTGIAGECILAAMDGEEREETETGRARRLVGAALVAELAADIRKLRQAYVKAE